MTVGQWHHVLSNRVMDVLNTIPSLRGHFTRGEWLVQGALPDSHMGYQQWHRFYDGFVTYWLRAHPDATPSQFTEFLRRVYNTPDMHIRFPCALLVIH